MPKRIRLRTLTAEEEQEIRRLANARSEPVRLVQRAQIIEAMLDAPDLAATEAGVRAGYSNAIGATWVRRFNEEGVEGLQDRPREGRPRTHSEKVRSALINLALQKPRTLGYPFALWTLERLQRAFKEREGVHLSDSTIWTWMAHRATFEPDYGRRGKVWVHGAFEPATGQATIVISPSRDSASHIQLLERVIREFPADRWLLVADNLSIHTSHETTLALAAWPEIRVQLLPTQAPWLNLIEPWWKQLRSLALKGRRFESTDELTASLCAALDYWNEHRHPYQWKKKPQEQLLIGGFGVSHNYSNI